LQPPSSPPLPLPTTKNVDLPSQFNQKSNYANIQNPLAPWRASRQPRTSCVPVPKKKSTHVWLLWDSHEYYPLFPQFAPVSGEVTAINEKLGDQPSLLNKSPEDEGTWLASHPVSCSSTHFPR
jgi:hypothetical protein